MARVPFDPATDYYHLLGVDDDASAEEIQAAYRRLAKEYHPDLNAGSAVAAARMASVNLAKTVLLDRETRANYDQLRAARRQYKRVRVPQGPPPTPPAPGSVTVRYAPYQVDRRPRHRVVSSRVKERAMRGRFDRQSAMLLLVAIPLVAAVAMYVFQAIELSIQPLRAGPSDVNLVVGPNRPTPRGTAETAFMMVHEQPMSRELATQANNLILSRVDQTPDSDMLRADGRLLVRAAGAGDTEGWNTAVADLCRIAERC